MNDGISGLLGPWAPSTSVANGMRARLWHVNCGGCQIVGFSSLNELVVEIGGAYGAQPRGERRTTVATAVRFDPQSGTKGNPTLIRVAECQRSDPWVGMASVDQRETNAVMHHNILIVDDHHITRSGLAMMFAHHDRFTVVGTLDRGATVNAFVQSQPVDLVILDLNMPDVRGINVLAELVGSRDMTVIILTGETYASEIDYALKLGARAIVSKSDPPDQIIAACDAALAGEVFISSHMRDALGKYQKPPVALSSRQMAILHYLAQGETNKEISYRLSIAQPTVSFHIAELRKKLDVTHNRKIVERAQELNLL